MYIGSPYLRAKPPSSIIRRFRDLTSPTLSRILAISIDSPEFTIVCDFCRPAAEEETEDGPCDVSAADGVQAEIRRPNTDVSRRPDPTQGYHPPRGLLLRPVRRRAGTEDTLKNDRHPFSGQERKRVRR